MFALSASPTGTSIFPPWHFSQWKAIDDRVRGGSSISHLDPFELPLHSSSDNIGSSKAARFWGTLDIKTLGGAGFASQKFTFGPEPLHLPRFDYNGITLTYLPTKLPSSTSSKSHKPETYTLNLKTSIPTYPKSQTPTDSQSGTRPEPASLTYEHSFKAQQQGDDEVRLDISFDDFVPMYRGREVKREDPIYVPLHAETIYEMGLMCRSGFGEQEGEFELVVTGIEGWGKNSALNKKGQNWFGKGIWQTLIWSFERVWNWLFTFRGSMGSRQGMVKLEDEEKTEL